MTKFRVVIADDHAILRSGLRMLIDIQPDMEVVGEADDWISAASELRRHTPDIMTVDLTMPGGDPFVQIRSLKRIMASTKLIVLTMHEDPAYFRAAIAAGADGYVLKKAADVELMTAIRCVLSGRVYSTIELRDSNPIAAADSDDGSMSGELASLSARELEVLRFAAQGLTNRAVAEKLFLSVKTVESYRARCMAKLGLKSRAELVKFAIYHGMLTPDSSPQE